MHSVSLVVHQDLFIALLAGQPFDSKLKLENVVRVTWPCEVTASAHQQNCGQTPSGLASQVIGALQAGKQRPREGHAQ